MLSCVYCIRTAVPPGCIDAYYQYNLKPWDVAAGAVILEEAGGRLTTADGRAYSVFDRSLLATNDALYEKVGAGLRRAACMCALHGARNCAHARDGRCIWARQHGRVWVWEAVAAEAWQGMRHRGMARRLCTRCAVTLPDGRRCWL